MIVTLTPNPALDITLEVPRVVPGESHRVRSVTERAGGKGLNTAGVLARMGHKCVAIAPVATSSIAGFAADLDARSVRHLLLPVAGATRRSIAVVDESGAATLFNESGEVLSHRTWELVLGAVRRASASAQVLTISGSLPPGVPLDTVHRITSEAHDVGLAVVLDISGPHLSKALAAGPEIVKPNRAEAAASVDGAQSGLSADELALALTGAGAQAAVVSDGPAGLSLISGDIRLRARLPSALRGNATGAGDALTASLAADLDADGTLAHGPATATADDWEQALSRAVAWSGAAVLQPIAGVIDPADVNRLLPTVEMEEITG